MRGLRNLGLAVLALSAPWTALAATETDPRPVVAHGREIFNLPPDPNRGEACDGRRLLFRDPKFGKGLVARYIYRRGPSQYDHLRPSHVTRPDDVEMTKNLRRRGIDAAFVRRGGMADPDASALDATVLRSHEDLIKRFKPFCEAPLSPGYYLVDIEYRRATALEREGKPLEHTPLRGVEPVKLRRYVDIVPKGAEVVDFTIPAAYWIARGTLELPAGNSGGMGTIFEFEGWYIQPDDDRVRKLTESGYQVLFIDFGGRRATVVIDTQPATSSEQLNGRARPVMEFEWGDMLYLKRIAHVPVRQADVEYLRLSPRARDDLLQQMREMAAHYGERDVERARRQPTVDEVEKLIVAGWLQGDAGSESTFGEVHDLKCDRADSIFTCKVGFTYLWNGMPKYRQEDMKFTRDPAKHFELVEYVEQIIVT